MVMACHMILTTWNTPDAIAIVAASVGSSTHFCSDSSRVECYKSISFWFSFPFIMRKSNLMIDRKLTFESWFGFANTACCAEIVCVGCPIFSK